MRRQPDLLIPGLTESKLYTKIVSQPALEPRLGWLSPESPSPGLDVGLRTMCQGSVPVVSFAATFHSALST
jgi:hypothetical protein